MREILQTTCATRAGGGGGGRARTCRSSSRRRRPIWPLRPPPGWLGHTATPTEQAQVVLHEAMKGKLAALDTCFTPKVSQKPPNMPVFFQGAANALSPPRGLYAKGHAGKVISPRPSWDVLSHIIFYANGHYTRKDTLGGSYANDLPG